MKRATLILALLIPLTAYSQEQGAPSNDGDFAPALAVAAQDAKPPATPPPPPPQRPRPHGSMVGYIDNAIVETQLRIRFDAGFHTEFPDRAEFFYAKCGCYKQLVGSGLPATDGNAPGPGQGVATDLNFQQLYMFGEYALHNRISVFAEVPVRWLQPKAFVPGFGSFANQSGLADIQAGFKLGLLPSESGRYLTFQFRTYAPSGDASKGLGTNHATLEPSFLYYQNLTPRLTVESEFSVWHPIGGSSGVATASDPNPGRFSGNVLFYGVGPSYQLYTGNRVRFAPVVELAGWHVLSGYQTVWISATHIADKADGTNIVNLKLGGRLSIGRDSIYVGYGRGLTDAVWYRDLVRGEYRHSF